MAKMINGLFGGFSGRIGDKVGFIRKGVQYVRSVPKKRTGPLSPAQIAHREKFSVVVRFLAPLVQFIGEMHKYSPNAKTGYQKLFSLNFKNAISGECPSFSIECSKVQLTTGTLPCPGDMQIVCARRGFLDLRWTDRSKYSDNINPLDQLYFAAYDEGTRNWEVKKNIAERRDELAIIDMTAHRGSSLHIYAGFGSANRSNVSNSQYLGIIHVL